MNAQKIFLDAGHGGRDPGAVGPPSSKGRLQEHDVAHAIMLCLGRLLTEQGFNVAYSNAEPGPRVANWKRADMANAWGADLFISLHLNADRDADAPGDYEAGGEEILVYNLNSPAADVALRMAGAMDELVPGAFRGVKAYPGLTVLKRTKMPALLLELGFVDNRTEGSILADDPQRAASIVAHALMSALGKKAPAPKSEIHNEQQLRTLETENKELRSRLTAIQKLACMEG